MRWRRTAATLLGVSIGTYRRRRRDVVDTYHWDVVACFTWDLFETSWRCTDGTSLLCPLKTSSQDPSKTLWRRTTDTTCWRFTEASVGVSFEAYLRRRWDVQRDVAKTSPRRHVAGGITQMLKKAFKSRTWSKQQWDWRHFVRYPKYIHRLNLIRIVH